MIGKREEFPQYQSDFYRNCYHKIVNALLVSIVIIIMLILAIIYFAFFQAPTNYYASTSSGQIIPMTVVS